MDTPKPPPTPPRPELRAGGRWYFRVPVKILIFALVTIFVCFPYPRQLIRNIGHLRHMQDMIDPSAPELDAWELELHKRIAASVKPIPTTESATAGAMSPAAVQHEVERFVLEHEHVALA